MPAMLSEIYDALVEAGASQEKARAAAEAVAEYREGFIRIESSIGGLRAEMGSLRTEMTSLRSDLMTNRWILGFMFVAVLFVLGMNVNHGAKLSRIETQIEQLGVKK